MISYSAKPNVHTVNQGRLSMVLFTHEGMEMQGHTLLFIIAARDHV